MDGRMNVTEIDDDEHVVFFDQWGRKKKITGTKMGAILGCSRFSTPFKVALEIARIYPGDPPNKYMDAGNVIEPVIRNYVRANADVLPEMLCLPSNVAMTVEEPVEKESCGYDHFHDNPVFGGLVDGYIDVNGKRAAILEIKTSSHRDQWLDEYGNVTRVPPDYMLQAGLYANLSGLDEIIFAVGFLEPKDYDRPQFWKPTPDNCAIVHVPAPDMTEPMATTEEWYHTYIDKGETPAWTEADAELVKWLKSYDAKAEAAKGGSGRKKPYKFKRFRCWNAVPAKGTASESRDRRHSATVGETGDGIPRIGFRHPRGGGCCTCRPSWDRTARSGSMRFRDSSWS